MTAPARPLTPFLLTGVFLASLEMAIVHAVLPRIANELHDAGLLPWVFAGYVGASTVATPLVGWWADRAGRRSAYALGMAALLAGSVVAALAPTMPVLLVGRVLQGIGAGAMMPVTIIILGDRYAVHERAKQFGFVSIVWGGSTLIGPLIGAWLTEQFGWRSIFWINLLPGAIALVGVLRGLPGATAPHGGGGWRIAGLFKHRQQVLLNLSGPLAIAAMYGIISHAAVWVQGVQGGTTLQSGLRLLPMSLSWTLASQFAGPLLRRYGFGPVMHVANAVLAAGLLVTWLWPMDFAGLALTGLALGVLVTCYNLAIQEMAPADRKGTATSVAIFLRNLGAALAVPIYGHLAGFRAGIEKLSEVPGLAEGVQRVLAGCLAAGLAGALLVWLLLPWRARLVAGDA